MRMEVREPQSTWSLWCVIWTLISHPMGCKVQPLTDSTQTFD
jgi:hypothetical protein